MKLDLNENPERPLDYLRMLTEVDDLVSTGEMEEMSLKRMPNSKPYTQDEAEHMADIIGKVYLVAHAIRCGACAMKYVQPRDTKPRLTNT